MGGLFVTKSKVETTGMVLSICAVVQKQRAEITSMRSVISPGIIPTMGNPQDVSTARSVNPQIQDVHSAKICLSPRPQTQDDLLCPFSTCVNPARFSVWMPGIKTHLCLNRTCVQQRDAHCAFLAKTDHNNFLMRCCFHFCWFVHGLRQTCCFFNHTFPLHECTILFQEMWQGSDNHPVSYQSWTNFNFNQSSLERLTVLQNTKLFSIMQAKMRRRNEKHNCLHPKFFFSYNKHVNEIQVYNEHVNVIQYLSVTKIQPSYQTNKAVHCLAVLLLNLAHPQWVTVNCSKPMISDITCIFYKKEIKFANYLLPQTEICPHQIKINGKCFSLIPFSGKSFLQHPSNLSLSVFKLLIKAVGENVRYFLNINPLHTSEIQTVTFNYIWKTFEVNTVESSNAVGFYINEDHVVSVKMPNELLFRCVSGNFVSKSLVCDSVSHCIDHNREPSGHEYLCDCGKKMCKRTCLENKCKCSPLFYKSVDKTCSTYISSTEEKKTKF